MVDRVQYNTIQYNIAVSRVPCRHHMLHACLDSTAYTAFDHLAIFLNSSSTGSPYGLSIVLLLKRLAPTFI